MMLRMNSSRHLFHITALATGIAIVGCGYVADLYVATLPNHPGLELVGAFDREPDRRYKGWASASGAPWPHRDEFKGVTLEHAGYLLTWLVAFFGPARACSTAPGSCCNPAANFRAMLPVPRIPQRMLAAPASLMLAA